MTRTSADIESMTTAGLNLIKQAMSIYDNDLRLVVANLQFQKMFDLPDALVKPGSPFDETIRHLGERGDYGEIGDLETFVAERVEQARAFVPHYVERTRSNGTTISVEGSPLRQGGWVAVYTDITEIKRQEALLRDRSANLSEELLARSEQLSQTNRALTSTITALEEAKHELTVSQDRLKLTNSMIPAHMARVNIHGVYTYSNFKLDTVIPDKSPDIIGKHFRDALGQDVFEEIEPSFRRALEGEDAVHEFELAAENRHIRIAMTPDLTAEGQVIGIYILSTDVTEEVNARTALTHARRRELAAQLTSGLAHDFSNLLTIILGQQSKLSAIEGLDPIITEISDTIKSAALRGGALLDSLSSIDAQRPLDVKPVHVRHVFAEFEKLAQAAVPETMNLSITIDVPDSHLMMDPGFAQDALLNLVLNAAEASLGTGQITLHVQRSGSANLLMTVEDEGPGFTAEALKNALTPFYTSKGSALGRGLGLSTAFDFAKSSGGSIKLANRDPGGAAVAIRIPYEPAKPVEPGLVLLVEDTLEIRETIRGYLRRMGHQVIEATTADEAAKLAHVPGITHVLSDLVLDDGSTGVDLAKTLTKQGIDAPLTFVTGLPKGDTLRQEAEGMAKVLQKPFDFKSLSAHFQMWGKG